MSLDKNDYQEPVCPFDFSQWKEEPAVRQIPVGRVLEKLDEHYSRSDYAAAVRLAEYWIGEAKYGNDLRGEFAVRNELMGVFRKTGQREKATDNASLCLELIDRMDMNGSVTHGTALVNAATVYKAFGMPERSLELFRQAEAIYGKELSGSDYRLASLYNNMSVTLCDLGYFEDAASCQEKALDILSRVEDSEGEQAVSWLNLADIYEQSRGAEASEEDVRRCCEKAVELLNSATLPRDGNYAFYCEKCAPVLSYYGFFIAAEELSERAKDIYDRR
ncbi:MAG: tetratricopeptide repeat protein [Firmicutes bacterium]|nr:tetratricopeptide repeat protein [Bacillota bacterium]